MVGDLGVGKTSLVLKFCDGEFLTTAPDGIDSKRRNLIVDGEDVTLEVWDTAGQERFRNVTSSYFRGALGVIVVYDVSDRESFENLEQWLQETERLASENAFTIVLGAKSDMDAVVDRSTVETWCKSHNLAHFLCSARSGVGVDEMFTALARVILSRAEASNGQMQQQDQNSICVGKPLSQGKQSNGGCTI